MSESMTSQQAIEARNAMEQALIARINQTFDRLDACAGNYLPQPNDAGYLAEDDRTELFYKADRIKFAENNAAERFEIFKSPWVWSTRTCQPFPGRNRFVKKLDDGLELWFRIEFAFRGFAGFTVYNPAAKSLIPFRDIPEDVANGIFEDFGITSEEVAQNCWWVYNEYLPYGPEETCPNFRMLDDLSLSLLDDEAFERFCMQSEELIIGLIKRFVPENCLISPIDR